MITIYHNPRCTKSREALALLQQFSDRQDEAVHVIDYQKTPLTAAQLRVLHRQLGGQAGDLRDMVREGEPEFTALNLAHADQATLLQALAEHPRLLQRPIVVRGDRAVIGRPVERLHQLLTD
jgi:arsenate reductase